MPCESAKSELFKSAPENTGEKQGKGVKGARGQDAGGRACLQEKEEGQGDTGHSPRPSPRRWTRGWTPLVGGEWTPATGNLVQVPALPLRNMGPEQATFPLWSPVPSTGKKGGLRGSPQ